MRRITLREYQSSEPLEVSAAELAGLGQFDGAVGITPAVQEPDSYILTPNSRVGVINLPTLTVEIQPKLPIDRLFFLILYAIEHADWQEQMAQFEAREDLLEAIVPAFARQVRRALRRGILQGYRTEEEALATVRGRIRFGDQIRRHQGRFPPVEVRYDDFTEDILENRLIKAAISRLRRLRFRSERSRRLLLEFDATLQRVAHVEYPPNVIPDMHYTRLNDRYRPAIELAKVILRATSLEHRHGGARASAFLINMNNVFEEFVLVALREALGLPERAFPRQLRGRRLHLDRAGRVNLLPDLSWWDGGHCVFAGDAKYKNLKDNTFKHADLYQMLAYTIAADLPGGLLIYAKGEEEETTHVIPNVGKTIRVLTLDLDQPPDGVLNQIGAIAAQIQASRVRTEPVRLTG